jgi:hypothetical protein
MPVQLLPEVVRLRRLGVDVEGNATPRKVTTLPGHSASDSDLACLGRFAQLDEVHLMGPNLSGGVLRYLRPCTELGILELRLDGVDDQSLENLTAWPKLRSLTIHGGCYSEKGMKFIGRLKALVSLSLRDAPIGDRDMECLKNLTELEYLDLGGTHVTDAGIAYLLGLDNLSGLSLAGTAITDNGVASLVRLRGLRNLALSDTGVTVKSLEDLLAMKELEYVVLEHTSVRMADLARLRRARPKLEIWINGGLVGGTNGAPGAARVSREKRNTEGQKPGNP